MSTTTIVTVTVALTSDLVARLDSAAAADGRTRSGLTRRILTAALSSSPDVVPNGKVRHGCAPGSEAISSPGPGASLPKGQDR